MVILAYFAVIALAFFLLIVRPQRRRLAAHHALVSGLDVGDEVITTGGIFGVIRSLDDERVDLEVAEGVVISIARAAIAQSANPARPAETPELDEHPAENGTSDD